MNDVNISQRKIGIILSYVSEAVKIIVGLVYTPIMLRLLGQSEYGLYQLVFSVVSYLYLLNLGFGSSYLRFYSRYKAKNDYDGISRLNGMFLVVFSVMAIICILCGIVMINNVQFIFGTKISVDDYKIAKILMWFMVINLAITFPNSIFDCIITAHEKFLFQKMLILMQNICSPVVTLPLLMVGFGSVGMVAVTTGLTFLAFVINIMYCIKKLKVTFSFKKFQFSLFKEIWVFTFFIFLEQIVNQINWNIDKLLLGRYSGTNAVAVYGIASQINTLYMHFSTAISNVYVPKVNKLVTETNSDKKLTELFTRVGRIQFMVMFLILTGFIFIGMPFIKLWAGEEYYEAYYAVLMLIIPVTVPLIQNIGIEIQRAKNKHRIRSVVYCFIAVGNVAMSIPLIAKFGVVGAAAGTMVSLFLGNGLFINWFYHKHIGLDIIFFWKQILKFIPALIIPSIAGICIMKFAVIDSWLSLFVYGGIYTLIYGISIFFIGLNNDEKNVLDGIIKKFVK